MRIDEITNSNIVWGKLSGVDLTSVDEYNAVISLIKSLIQLNSHRRVVTYQHTIIIFENNLSQLISLDTNGYPNQQDIVIFKRKCKKMLRNIQHLRSQLP